MKRFKIGLEKKANPLDQSDDDTPTISVQIAQQSNSMAKKAKELQRNAIKDDPTVFDYDASYTDIKQAQNLRKRVVDGPDKKARYMGDLIAAAAQRKLYLEKAKDRRLQKERELEKDIYGDKEQFVTEAYLEKQRELQRLEMEEKMREEQEADPRRPRNLALFYSSIDSKHQVDDKTIAQLKDYERAKENAKLEQDKQTKLKIEQGLVQVNESGEIIDNLQLLQGGINAPIRAKMIPKEDLKVNEQQSTDKKELLKRVQTAAAQKSEHIKQKEHQKETQEKDLQSKLKSSLDKESIMSAKERFLQRKRQRENANVITITPQTKNKLHHEECD